MAGVVLLLLLVCVFTVAEDSLSITCDDVTGHMGDKLNLTCRVSYQNDTCYTENYKFMNKDKGTTICRDNFTSYSCKQWTTFSCPYTANEALTSLFKFFIQTTYEAKEEDFTVTIAGNKALIASITSGLIIIVITVIYIVVFILKKKCNSADIQRDYNLVQRTTDVTSTTVNV